MKIETQNRDDEINKKDFETAVINMLKKLKENTDLEGEV